MPYELVYVSIISGIFGILGLLLFQRGNITTWAAKMDYKLQEYGHKERIETIRGKRNIEREQLKRSNPKTTSDLLGSLANLDLDQVQDILEKAEDLRGATGEEGGLMSLINSPLVRGLLSGAQQKLTENKTDEGIVYES